MPDAVVVRLTDDELFECAFTFMEDAGTAHFTDAEVARLRQYLLKGGFLLVSDYHGTLAQQQFDDEIGRVLQRHEFPIVDLAPPDHPLWRTMFQVKSLPQLASINTWRRTKAAQSNAGTSRPLRPTRAALPTPEGGSWS